MVPVPTLAILVTPVQRQATPELVPSSFLKKKKKLLNYHLVSLLFWFNTPRKLITNMSLGRNWQNSGTRWPNCSRAAAQTCTASGWRKKQENGNAWIIQHSITVSHFGPKKNWKIMAPEAESLDKKSQQYANKVSSFQLSGFSCRLSRGMDSESKYKKSYRNPTFGYWYPLVT